MSKIHLQFRESKCRCACCHDDDDGSLQECVCGAKFHADCGPCPTIGCDDDEDEYLRKLFAPDPFLSLAPSRSRPWKPQYLGICGGCGRGRMPGPRGWSATKCGKCQANDKWRAEVRKKEAIGDKVADILMWLTLLSTIIIAGLFAHYQGG